MKKFWIPLIVLTVILLAGCASWPRGVTGYFSDVPITLRGEATTQVWLGFFGPDHPSAEEIARRNGITTISSVERFTRPGILNLWIEITTVVTGI